MGTVARLLEELQSEEAYRRKLAAEELGKIKIDDEQVVRDLKFVAASDDNKYVRGAAEQALYNLGHELPLKEKEKIISANLLDEKVSELLQGLKSKEADRRKSAAEELGELKIDDKHVISDLKFVAISDDNEYVRNAAEKTLHKLGHELTSVEKMSQMPPTKKCPFCAEQIRAEAIVCRYCGRDLPGATSNSRKRILPRPLHWFWYLVFGIFTLLIFAAVLFFGAYFLYPELSNASLDELQKTDPSFIIALLLTYLLIGLLATKGRYGNFKILNLLIIFFWMLIPILNWGIVYYLGKGVYMWVSDQEYTTQY